MRDPSFDEGQDTDSNYSSLLSLGSMAPEPAVERRAGVGHDQGRRLFGSRGRDTGGLADAAVRADGRLMTGTRAGAGLHLSPSKVTPPEEGALACVL